MTQVTLLNLLLGKRALHVIRIDMTGMHDNVRAKEIFGGERSKELRR